MPKLLALPTAPSPFQQHVERWKGCTLCYLHEGRRNVVLSRGKLPCEILFIAEAPGFSEDNHAIPLVGPAGDLLNRIIADAERLQRPFVKAFTNIIACIPLGEDRKKTESPDPNCVKKCRPRLVEYVRIAKPKAIILVGNEAAKYVRSQSDFEPVDWLPVGQDFIYTAEITHPSGVGRQNAVLQASLYKKAVVTIASTVEMLDNTPPF